MFQPQFFLSFGNINYNLRENEIIMIQSSLTQEYFEHLVPASMNSYVKFNSYDEVEPLIGQTYENVIPNKGVVNKGLNKSLIKDPNKKSKTKVVVEEDDIDNKNDEEVEEEDKEALANCKPVVNIKISSGLWGKCFSKNFKELEYNNLTYCTFTFISYLIEKSTHIKLSISQIKNVLVIEYKKYFPRYFNKILDILILEGKKKMGEKVEKIGQQVSERDKKDKISFDDFINDESYFLTPFDLWILVQKFKVPCIFLNKTVGNLLETNNTNNLFLGYGFEGDSFAFIIIPGLRAENIPSFKYIITNTDELFIPIDSIKNGGECRDKIQYAIQNGKTIEEMLASFMKKPKNKDKPVEIGDELLPIKKKETRGRKPNFIINEPIFEPEQPELGQPELGQEQILGQPELGQQVLEEPIVLNNGQPKTRKNNKKLKEKAVTTGKTLSKKALVNKRKLLIIDEGV
jgi:hypothetical protein